MRRFALLIFLALLGCAMKDMIMDMVHVQRCVSQRSGTNSMNVKMSGKRLTIDLVNSPIDTLPAAARTTAAKHVAECVRDNYRRWGSLDEVAIGFTQRRSVGPVRVSTSGGPVIIKASELGQPAAPPADSSASHDTTRRQ